MANTQTLKNQVEVYVRDRLEVKYSQPFTKRKLPVGHKQDGSAAMHEFDAVSADGSIVVGIKSSSGRTSGGRYPSGKVATAYQELYFLSLAKAERRILVLTNPELHKIFRKRSDGKVAPGLKLKLISLPPELEKQAQAVQRAASQEMSGSTDQEQA